MNSPTHRSPFELSSAAAFDARRGYQRCDPPGLGVQMDRRSAHADLWRDCSGRLLVRFSSSGYVWSMECSLASGKRVPDTRLESCVEWLRDVLVEWMVDGVDDEPEPMLRYRGSAERQP